MNPDELLLAPQTDRPSAAEQAGALRSGRRAKQDGGPGGSDGGAQTLRQAVQAARSQQGGGAGQAGGALAAAGPSSIRRSTSKLLQQSWLNLIDSFGLTLIWINIHVFLKTVLGEKLFCKLGEEWLPEGTAGAIDSVGGEKLKKAKSMVGLVEVMGLLLLDFLVILILFAAFVIIRIIIGVMTYEWEVYKKIFLIVWDMFVGFLGLG